MEILSQSAKITSGKKINFRYTEGNVSLRKITKCRK